MPPPATVDPAKADPLEATFQSIRTGDQLLVNNCSGTRCGPVTFEDTIRLADRVKGTTSSLETFARLLNQDSRGSFKEMMNRWGSEAPLHQLAVANRMDLAHWNNVDKKWHGAELRFLFGGNWVTEAKRPVDLTLIVEFELEALSWKEFRDLAGLWKCDGESSCVPAVLTWAREAGRLRDVRIRANYNLVQEWRMQQWKLDRVGGWRETLLDNQLDQSCYKKDTEECADLYTEWDRIVKEPQAKTWNITTESLLMMGAFYGKTAGVMPMLKDKLDEHPRRILGLQQCTQCHLGETNTEFNHVSNRKPSDATAKLSRFLEGNGPGPTDTIKDIAERAFPVSLTVPGLKSKLERAFYDLGRRRMFLASVLCSGAEYNIKDQEQIEDYAVNFTH